MRIYNIDEEERMRRSKALKERWKQGRMNKMKKLTEAEVLEIVSLLKQGEQMVDIAAKYDIGQTAIFKIKNGLSWKHLTTEEEIKQMQDASLKLTREEILGVANDLIENKLRQVEIARKYQITSSLVTAIKKGKAYRDIITDDILEKIQSRKEPPVARRLDEKSRIAIEQLLLTGKLSQAEIARMFGVNTSTVCRINKKLSKI